MKKLLIFIGILLIILTTFVLIRKHSLEKKYPNQEISFREFFTLGNNASQNEPNAPGELSSEFTDEIPAEGDTGTSPIVGGTSSFGNVPALNPIQGSVNGMAGINGTGSVAVGTVGVVGTAGTAGVVTGGVVNTGSSGSGGTASGLLCTPADSNITFTAAELTRLKELETRFNAIAPSLYSDADLKKEQANYDFYKLTTAKFAEYRQYCEQQTPRLPDQSIVKRLATPFWRNAATDTNTFVGGPDTPGVITIGTPSPSLPEVERIFKLHIW
jgi:hypothetical protein